VRAFGATSNDSLNLAKPPQPKFFRGSVKSSRINLGPGHIKKVSVKSQTSTSLTDYLVKMNIDLLATTVKYNNYGKSACIALEKMLDNRSETASVNVNYEYNLYMIWVQTVKGDISENIWVQTVKGDIFEKIWVQTVKGDISENIWVQTVKGDIFENIWVQTVKGDISENIWVQTVKGDIFEKIWVQTVKGDIFEKIWVQTVKGDISEKFWVQTVKGDYILRIRNLMVVSFEIQRFK
jgi:uncharacterized membrane protein